MRGIIITLFFLFGPIILMFAMRHLTLLLRIWMRLRRAKGEAPEVIDVTPSGPHPPSRRFIAFAVIVGLICASLVWMRLADRSGPVGDYVPAHVNAEGTLVPGQHRKP